MASVPNRVYPLNEFPEIYADKVTSRVLVQAPNISGSVATITGSLNVSGAISGSRFIFRTTNTSIPSGTMSPGDIIFFTGAAVGVTGTNLFYVCVPSGSKNAIYVLSGSF